jgi:hypothetical protein
MAAKFIRLTHKIAIQLNLVAEKCNLQFLLQAASPETFGYTLVYISASILLLLSAIIVANPTRNSGLRAARFEVFAAVKIQFMVF